MLKTIGQEIHIIPEPVSITSPKIKSTFSINAATVIVAEGQDLGDAAQFFTDYLEKYYQLKLKTSNSSTAKNSILLKNKKNAKAVNGAYNLSVANNQIVIEGENAAGAFYGIQTLIQLLPVNNTSSLEIPAVAITDYPRFGYRGLMLDAGRHFFPVDFVKKYLDFIALHKMNYMHWHLTEDQGWRIEIKQYPRLTEIGAWRNGTVIGHFPGTASDNTRSGGFYTQEDIKEVIAYARKRYITIIPEIEMPGHGIAAIAAYPWLSCFENMPTKLSPNAADLSKQQGGKQVQETWGVFEDVFCAGNDSTFTFLQNVIDEVAALFPSPYIHVGGDECPKTNWKKCPKCQARMQQLGLKTEHELQSYFVQRMEKYVNAKGKKLIGWDEILEGGLAPNATVMSWRGEKGGIDAAKQNHDVIMTPTTYVYFDYAQSKKEDSLVIGGFLPIEKVYGYDPIPEVLPSSQAKYILGAQANVWTEYIGNSRKMEYVIFPRMSALSEVLWSPKTKKNFDNFRKKLQTQIERFNLWKVHYSKAIYDLHASILPTKNYKGVLWKLESNLQLLKDCNTNIGITDQPYTDALTANKERISIANAQAYKGPILVQASKSLKAVLSASCSGVASKDWDNITQVFFINKASGKKITLAQAPASNWSGNGAAFGLVNGVVSDNGINSSEWLGWQGKDMEATIDLGAVTSISSINCHILDRKESWIYPPLYIEAFTSNDGIKYQPAGKTNQYIATKDGMQNASINLSNTNARYAKIIARNFGSIPDGQEGAGNPAWFFADEIQIN